MKLTAAALDRLWTTVLAFGAVVLVGRDIRRLFVRRAADRSEPDRSDRDPQRHRGELCPLFRRRTRCVSYSPRFRVIVRPPWLLRSPAIPTT